MCGDLSIGGFARRKVNPFFDPPFPSTYARAEWSEKVTRGKRKSDGSSLCQSPRPKDNPDPLRSPLLPPPKKPYPPPHLPSKVSSEPPFSQPNHRCCLFFVLLLLRRCHHRLPSQGEEHQLPTISFQSGSRSPFFNSDVKFYTIPSNLFPQIPDWEAFARRVSGEWDGFGAEFTADGRPVELPEAVVPEAFREWGVQLFDWQTQCPTLAAEAGDPVLSYNLIKLLPTVGCEADAATRHSVEERIAGGTGNKVSAFGYDSNGCYVAVWPLEGRNGQRFLELEHCLVDPGNREARVRVIQLVGIHEGEMRLEGIRVFSEQWYGPFRNGEQLGGCAIGESGFASTAAVEESEVVGVWQGTSVAVARFQSEQTVS